jgi:hypothetical protein
MVMSARGPFGKSPVKRATSVFCLEADLQILVLDGALGPGIDFLFSLQMIKLADREKTCRKFTQFGGHEGSVKLWTHTMSVRINAAQAVAVDKTRPGMMRKAKPLEPALRDITIFDPALQLMAARIGTTAS